MAQSEYASQAPEERHENDHLTSHPTIPRAIESAPCRSYGVCTHSDVCAFQEPVILNGLLSPALSARGGEGGRGSPVKV